MQRSQLLANCADSKKTVKGMPAKPDIPSLCSEYF